MARQPGHGKPDGQRVGIGLHEGALIQGDYFVSWVPRLRILAGGGDGGLQDAGSVALAGTNLSTVTTA